MKKYQVTCKICTKKFVSDSEVMLQASFSDHVFSEHSLYELIRYVHTDRVACIETVEETEQSTDTKSQ